MDAEYPDRMAGVGPTQGPSDPGIVKSLDSLDHDGAQDQSGVDAVVGQAGHAFGGGGQFGHLGQFAGVQGGDLSGAAGEVDAGVGRQGHAEGDLVAGQASAGKGVEFPQAGPEGHFAPPEDDQGDAQGHADPGSERERQAEEAGGQGQGAGGAGDAFAAADATQVAGGGGDEVEVLSARGRGGAWVLHGNGIGSGGGAHGAGTKSLWFSELQNRVFVGSAIGMPNAIHYPDAQGVGRLQTDISVLIPVFNRVALTRACLDSLFRTLPEGLAAEVFVYDDRSTDATLAYLETQRHRVTVLRGETRGSFAKNNNAMARMASGRHLVLLNNDTVLTPGWLEPMLELAAEPAIGVVANWHTVPGSTTVNHAGVVFDPRKRSRHLYEGMDIASLEPARDPREFQAVCAACCVIPSDLYRRVGGFDESFRTGYEDLDLCLRVRQTRAAVLCTGRSMIGHHGSSTPGRFEYDRENRRLFESRWFDAIIPDLAAVPDADDILWPTDTVVYKAARTVWHSPVGQAVIKPVLQTSLGVKARQGVQRRLSSQ